MNDQQNMWWNEVKLILWENEEDFSLGEREIGRTYHPSLPFHGLKNLRVMISDDFLFESHLTETLCSSSQSLHALRVLKSQGMSQPLLRTVFKATALAKLLYCSSVWWGFARWCDRNRLEAFLRRAIRAGYYDENDLTFSELCERNH